ncbi:MAG: superoxide dismutase [Cu-Zn] SodC [Rhodocyclaceae bacterium]
MNKRLVMVAALALPAWVWAAAPVEVNMNLVDAQGGSTPIGSIKISESPYGVVFTPDLSNLPAGVHGFHVHEKADCGPAVLDGKPTAAGAAGGHLDPKKTGKHEGPWGKGHLGDLPALYVTADGHAMQPVLAPRLKMRDLPGHALMVHAGGDNHMDAPEKLGGGGARVACGVIK